ncbi:hypothetical protein CYLTODRAFT_370112 [Cylindrobasidium torrendii FP15055 ss-10]|uniref:TM7S3/TM198-like domain-containing protein n=1 Tax=Cylindrobasidium torrendii FP15055 ss-10 TaxID=1314674 RepID=A0A0D7BN21_9AGAR|nr:hypothetical protein CYLTODRAFT_370112 [Cylindrobasidium torrendii FP15055 ss-10]
MRWSWFARGLLLASAVFAQDNNDNSSGSQQSSVSRSQSTSRSVTLSAVTSSVTITTTVRNGNDNNVLTTVVPTTFSATITPTSTSASASAAASASESAAPITLETKVDPAFGVLGAVLIITGLPMAFWGHKNRWTSFFLIGFYTFSLVCIVLILKFGVLDAIHPPSKTVRGMFMLASGIAGIVGGGIAIFFWKGARYLIGAWGGLALGWWIQCFRDGGLITNVGLRWVLYIGCAVVGFVLCTFPKIHYHILLISTAIVGATSVMLGVDCYTTAGLKEFYIWNLGFVRLFPKYTNNGIKFPVEQTMQIELGLMGAIALMGAAVQLRILNTLQQKLKEIQEEQKKRDEEADLSSTAQFGSILKEREAWEKEHGHGRMNSALSNVPLLKDQDSNSSPRFSPATPEWSESGPKRGRYASNVSSFFAPQQVEDDSRGTNGLLTVDLGNDVQNDMPETFMTKDSPEKKKTPAEEAEAKRLQAEIAEIRRSIDVLKSDPSISDPASRRPSFSSRRTLSIGAESALLSPVPASHLRPPRADAPRGRVHSMELDTLANSRMGDSISRPTSVPLRDNMDWDGYVQDRKLLQPPSGVTPPLVPSRISMSPAVFDALELRKRRESAIMDSDDDLPLAKTKRHTHSRSRSGSAQMLDAAAHRYTPPDPTGRSSPGPVHILPPNKNVIAPQPRRPNNGRTHTFEELTERHQAKMKDIQGPVTTAQKEEVELANAKARWERSKALEREAVNKRQAERAAQQEKKGHSADDDKRRHSSQPLSSKRMSTMKVQDWQRHQEAAPAEPAPVPFPDSGNKHQRRKSRDALN